MKSENAQFKSKHIKAKSIIFNEINQPHLKLNNLYNKDFCLP